MSNDLIEFDPKIAKWASNVFRAFFGKFQGLTTAQKKSFIPIVNGLDTLLLSGTGSGKTEAAVVPLVCRYFVENLSQNGTSILYVVPTKALANDVEKRLQIPLSNLNLSVAIRHGERDDTTRKNIPDILITTPESLDVLVTTKPGYLESVKAVIIDEAHLLLNASRGFQLAIVLSRIQVHLERSFQIIGLSATVENGHELWNFFRPNTQCVLVDAVDPKELKHLIYLNQTRLNLQEKLSEIINKRLSGIKILIFVDSRRECDELASELRDSLAGKIDVWAHHASLSPEVRLEVELAINSGKRAICVATPTLELGIDIGDIDLVILWGRPPEWQNFLQRIGRGNRRENFSTVICAVPAGDSVGLENQLGFQSVIHQIKNRFLPKTNAHILYGVVLQQICVILSQAEGRFLPMSLFLKIFAPWPEISAEVLRAIFASLGEANLVVKDGNGRGYGPGQRTFEIRDKRLIWSNLGTNSNSVSVLEGSKILGNIPYSNLFRINSGDVINFNAQKYRVTEISTKNIKVVPTTAMVSKSVRFGGISHSTHPSLLFAINSYLVSNDQIEVRPRSEHVNLQEFIDQVRPSVQSGEIPFFLEDGKYLYLTFAGLLLNSVIARTLNINIKQTSQLFLKSDTQIDFSKLPFSLDSQIADIGEFLASNIELSPFQSLLPPELLSLEIHNLWRNQNFFTETWQRLATSRTRYLGEANLRLG
jgi:ATP-dependent helicase Lhr and Lhr-like helicase